MQTVDLEKVIQNLQIELQEYPTIAPEDDLMERFRKRVIPKLVQNVIEYLKKQPTVDAVEVVRCKDCKHKEDCIRRIQFWGRNPVLELNTTEYHPIDFCSYGDRETKG